eukprot:3941540-Rhodomonas_salina.3
MLRCKAEAKRADLEECDDALETMLAIDELRVVLPARSLRAVRDQEPELSRGLVARPEEREQRRVENAVDDEAARVANERCIAQPLPVLQQQAAIMPDQPLEHVDDPAGVDEHGGDQQPARRDFLCDVRAPDERARVQVSAHVLGVPRVVRAVLRALALALRRKLREAAVEAHCQAHLAPVPLVRRVSGLDVEPEVRELERVRACHAPPAPFRRVNNRAGS